MGHAFHLIGDLVSPPWTSAASVLWTIMRAVGAAVRRVFRVDASSVRSVSATWLLEHEIASNKRGEEP
jgi:hypothetical protein